MKFIHALFLLFFCAQGPSYGHIPVLKKNVLNFGYGVNTKIRRLKVYDFLF